MSNVYLLTSSGFILSDNKHYEVLTYDQASDASLFARTSFANTNSSLLEEVKSNQIYHSVAANNAYAKYATTGSFEDYMDLVDLATDILTAGDYLSFFAIQAGNKNMSPISFRMCVELYNFTFLKTYPKYITVPANIRLTSDNGLTSSQIAANIREFKKNNMSEYTSNWVLLLSELADNRGAFSTFFKYVFVDAY